MNKIRFCFTSVNKACQMDSIWFAHWEYICPVGTDDGLTECSDISNIGLAAWVDKGPHHADVQVYVCTLMSTVYLPTQCSCYTFCIHHAYTIQRVATYSVRSSALQQPWLRLVRITMQCGSISD